MSKKEELSEQYRRKAYEVSPTRKRCQYDNEVIAWNNEIVGAFESGWDACEAESIETIKTAEDHAYFAGSEAMREKLIDKACDAYCKDCGHYAHKTPTHICRQDCDYYERFRKTLMEE